jgi:hypothetical protein
MISYRHLPHVNAFEDPCPFVGETVGAHTEFATPLLRSFDCLIHVAPDELPCAQLGVGGHVWELVVKFLGPLVYAADGKLLVDYFLEFSNDGGAVVLEPAWCWNNVRGNLVAVQDCCIQISP